MTLRLSLIAFFLALFSCTSFALTQKELNQLLFEAVKAGDVDRAEDALRLGADPDDLDDAPPNLLPLEIIARQRTQRLVDATLVRLLFEHGATIGTGDNELAATLSAMQFAIVRNLPNALERVIPRIDNPTFALRLEFGNALRMAVARGRDNMVEILLRRGVFNAGLFPSLFELARAREAQTNRPQLGLAYTNIEALLQAYVLEHPPAPLLMERILVPTRPMAPTRIAIERRLL